MVGRSCRGSVLLFQVIFIFLCCQIFSAQSQEMPFNWAVTVSVSGSTPTFNRTTPVNLPSGNLYITHNSTVFVCLKRAFEVPTDVNKWSSTNCDYFQVFNGTITPPTPPTPPTPSPAPVPPQPTPPSPAPGPVIPPSPEPRPEPQPTPSSEPTPEPTPEPRPEPQPTPSSEPEPVPIPIPVPTPSTEPEPVPTPSTEPGPVPHPLPVPTPSPSAPEPPIPVPTPSPSAPEPPLPVPTPSPPPPPPSPSSAPQPVGLTMKKYVNIFLNGVESIPVVLANDVYYIGIAFEPNKPPPPAESITIQINGTSCTGGYIWNGMNCIDPISTLPNEGIFTGGNNHKSYLRYTIPEYTTRIQLSASVLNGNAQSIVGSYQSSPVVTKPKDQVNLAGTVPYPTVGEWQVEYSLVSDTTGANYTLNGPNIHVCPNASFVGEFCNETVVLPVNLGWALTVKFIEQGKWDYYKVITNTNPASYLWVSATTSGGAMSDFHLYVRRGSPPQLNTYDYLDCLVPPCTPGYAYTFALNNTQQNYTYFVGIYANRSTSYGIWWNSVCPPNCINNDDDSGECIWDGTNIGQCICDDGYTGLDCTQNTGTLPTQYIVLIIIASLVVLSALIGFFAWAYMQRKREGYSSLS